MIRSGKIPCNFKDLDLHLTLFGGQSFRWKSSENKSVFFGVAFSRFWELNHKHNFLEWKCCFGNGKDEKLSTNIDLEKNLRSYFRMDFDLTNHMELWKSKHRHFEEKSQNLQSGVRILDQEPLENLISFICSQNNHINRISTMVEYLCSKYGEKIHTFENVDYYAFPTLKALLENLSTLEEDLRKAKFGYRAKFISGSIHRIQEFGGMEWFEKLKTLPYKEARLELVKLPGIGFKVADCICLMSLGHLMSVPIDTHIFQIAQKYYMPNALSKVKSVTPKIYDDISDNFREVYGEFAGWAQAILFCAQLSRFKESKPIETNNKRRKKVERT